jgi:flagellar biosynthesis/type III secretory pathway chaperone
MLTLEATINTSVNADIDAMQQLLDLLHREESALLADNLDEIKQLTPIKAELINKLQQSNENRLTDFSNFNRSESFTVWLENQKNDSLTNAWQDLMSLTRQSKEINSTNSLLLNQLALRNQRYLSFLKGDNQQEALYGPDGLNAYKSAGHTIKG